MRPLPPAPFLKDSADAIRDANVEGQRQFEAENPGMKETFDALALKIKRMEEKLVLKRKREESPEGLFLTQEPDPVISTRVSPTTVSAGPYAGLQSASKRVHKTVSPDIEKNTSSTEKATAHTSLLEKKESATSFGPAKKTAKKGGVLKNVRVVESRAIENGPDWYATVDMRQNFSRGGLQDLKHLYTLLTYAINDAKAGRSMTSAFNHISLKLQEMEFYPSLSPILVMKSRLLDENGFRAIFENRVQGFQFPYYLRADAEILSHKWTRGQIDPHLYRGLTTKSGKGQKDQDFTAHVLDKTFEEKVSCNYVGAGDLVNGQWWPLQICALRDGAHGAHEAGIHGHKDQGAYSVVVSGGGYANIDNGNTLQYCGTKGEPNEPSAGTKMMRKACENQQPLRVLRSASLPPTNQYRPTRGIRYDGLYRITSEEILDQQTAMYRFTLSRLGGQDPIRYQGVGIIPSAAQVVELNKIRQQIR